MYSLVNVANQMDLQVKIATNANGDGKIYGDFISMLNTPELRIGENESRTEQRTTREKTREKRS